MKITDAQIVETFDRIAAELGERAAPSEVADTTAKHLQITREQVNGAMWDHWLCAGGGG